MTKWLIITMNGQKLIATAAALQQENGVLILLDDNGNLIASYNAQVWAAVASCDDNGVMGHLQEIP